MSFMNLEKATAKNETEPMKGNISRLVDFDIYHCNDVPTLIKNYIFYYNTERPSVKSGRKSPVQFRTEQGFPN